MIPQVEEIGREAQILPFRKSEMLDDREIPVLLERAPINISAEIAEAGGAEIRIARTSGWVQKRGRCERGRIQPSVEALRNAARTHTAANAGAGSEAGANR